MASWLIRIDGSSGKSTRSLLAICSGLQPCTQRRSPRCGLLRPLHFGPGGPTARPPPPRTTPDSRSCTYAQSCSFAASLATLGRWARRSACHCAIDALYSSPTFASTRSDEAPARSSTGCDATAARSLGHHDPEREAAQSPPVPRTTGSGPTPMKLDRDSRRQRGGTTGTPRATRHPPPPLHPRSSAHERPQPKTAPDPRATRPSAAPARAPAPDTAEPPAAARASSPPATSTVEVLRRPLESTQHVSLRFGAAARQASTARWAPRATASTTPSPRASSPLSRRTCFAAALRDAPRGSDGGLRLHRDLPQPDSGSTRCSATGHPWSTRG